MTTEVVKRIDINAPVRSQGTLKDLLEKSQKAIADVAAEALDAKKLTKMALLAASKQPKLLECTGTSLLKAVMTSAELGLDCSGTLGQAYLVPYGKEATLIPGYRGLIDLARRSGEVQTIYCRVVCANDHFIQRWGDDETIEHRPPDSGERGHAIGAYAIAVFKDGGRQREYMTHSEIEAIRSKSKAGNFGPWKDHWNEMAKKTVVRRLCKYLPCAIDSPLARGMEADDQTYDETSYATVHDAAEANAGQGRMRMPQIEPPKPVDNDEYDPTADPDSGFMFEGATKAPTVGDD